MISVNGVSKIYGETKESKIYANKGIDLSINDGEFVVILGHSGSGKTTLINMLSTLEKPTEGCIKYDDINVSDLSGGRLTRFRKDNIGFIFQQYHLISTLTVFENIEVVASLAKADKQDVYDLINSVNLNGKENKYPYQLSGGEQQRVSIARALVKKPKVLFCDEPTGALDESNGNQVLSLIKKVKDKFNITVIIVTHNPLIAEMADRVVTMCDGKIESNVVRDVDKNNVEVV